MPYFPFSLYRFDLGLGFSASILTSQMRLLRSVELNSVLKCLMVCNQEALRPIRFLNFMNQNPEIDGRYFPIAENRNQKSGLRKSEIGNRDSGNRKSDIGHPPVQRHVT